MLKLLVEKENEDDDDDDDDAESEVCISAGAIVKSLTSLSHQRSHAKHD